MPWALIVSRIKTLPQGARIELAKCIPSRTSAMTPSYSVGIPQANIVWGSYESRRDIGDRRPPEPLIVFQTLGNCG
jgi:hypothetical protein